MREIKAYCAIYVASLNYWKQSLTATSMVHQIAVYRNNSINIAGYYIQKFD